MPTCNYFLEGRCLKDDCPYLHVKVSAKADICKDFLVGYCKLAKEVVLYLQMNLLHLFLYMCNVIVVFEETSIPLSRF